MNGPRRMDRRDASAGLVHDFEGQIQVRSGPRGPPLEPVVHCPPANELRYEIRHILVLAECINREDVGMTHASHRARFGKKPHAEPIAEYLGAYELDGDVALELLVVGEPD